MSRKLLIVLLVILAKVGVASAEPLHIRSKFTIRTDGGSTLHLPPSYVIDESDWTKLNVEVKRLQDLETQLKAENASLRKSAESSGITWQIIAGSIAVGVAATICAQECW